MSVLARLAEIVLKLTAFKRNFSSAERLHALIAKDRRHGPVTPSASMRRTLVVTERTIAGCQAWDIAPRGPSTARALYFHGGSYVLDLIKYHWQLVERLVHESGATITVPRYPLAPEAAHHEVLAFAEAAYDEVRPDVVLGDSAGAGLTLALAQALRDAQKAQPRLLILLSPWLDVTMTDPKLAELDLLDPMLGIPGSVEAGRLYARHTDPRDPRISPLFGNLHGLPRMLVLTGTHDILHADALQLRARCQEEGITLDWLEGADMIHDWPLVVALPEARAAIRTMAARIVPRVDPR